jgi:hypothetical protein
MFKIGFFPQGGGGGISPDPIGDYNTILYNGTVAATTVYRYIAYQITGISTPISLQITNNLQTVSGGIAHVYYAIDPAWPYGNVLNDAFGAGPTSNFYANFTISNGSTVITVNPNDWLILGVDGTSSSGGSAISGSGTVTNLSNSGALLSSIVSAYRKP